MLKCPSTALGKQEEFVFNSMAGNCIWTFRFLFFRKQGEGSRQVDRIVHSVVVSRNKVGSAKEVGRIPSHGAAAGRAEGFVPAEEETQAGAQKETQERPTAAAGSRRR